MERKTKMQQLLKGIESYNPNNLSALEDYLLWQVSQKQYDIEPNLAILKLYQFYPHSFNMKVVKLILIKAIANIPTADFALCKYLINFDKLQDEPLCEIVELGTLLETCRFHRFWEKLKELSEVTSSVPDFEECARKFVAHVVGLTYRRIPYPLLASFLNLSDSTEPGRQRIARVMADQHWRLTPPDGLAAGGPDSLAAGPESWVEVNAAGSCSSEADNTQPSSRHTNNISKERVSLESLTAVATAFQPSRTQFFIKSDR